MDNDGKLADNSKSKKEEEIFADLKSKKLKIKINKMSNYKAKEYLSCDLAIVWDNEIVTEKKK